MFKVAPLAVFVSCVLAASYLPAQTSTNTSGLNRGSLEDRISSVKTVGLVYNKRIGMFSLIAYTEAQVDEHRKLVDKSISDYKQKQKALTDGIERLIADGRNPQSLVDERNKPYVFPFKDMRRLYKVIAVSVDNIEIEPSDEPENFTVVVPLSRILCVRTLKKLTTEPDGWFDLEE